MRWCSSMTAALAECETTKGGGRKERTEGAEEGRVFAFVERVAEVFKRRDGGEDGDDFGRFDDLRVSRGQHRQRRGGRRRPHLLLQVASLESEHASENAERDKVLVVDQLRGGEGGDGVEKELSAELEVADGEEVKAVVRLEAVSSIPVSSLVHQAAGKSSGSGSRFRAMRKLNAQLCLINVGRDELMVAMEEANSDDSETNVDTRSQSRRLGQRSLSRLDRRILSSLYQAAFLP